MKTLGTAFKQVYGEALKEYGFKKIKGKYPYYVRLIGDEIVHVITYAARPKTREGYKEYSVYGGVATVYRNCIDLDIPIPYNFEWLNSNFEFYKKKNPYEDYGDKSSKWDTFSYKSDDETSLNESLQYALYVTKQIMLPIFDEVNDLKSCIDFFEIFGFGILNLYTDKDFGQSYSGGEYNEGLINTMVFDIKQFSERQKKYFVRNDEYTKYLIQMGWWRLTDEQYEAEKKDSQVLQSRQIDKFKSVMDNPVEYDRVMKELQRRKEFNTEKLKHYGIK